MKKSIDETYVPVVERKYEKPLLGCMPEDCPLIDIPVRDFGPCATTTACESSSNPLDWYDALVHPWPAKEREPQVILK